MNKTALIVAGVAVAAGAFYFLVLRKPRAATGAASGVRAPVAAPVDAKDAAIVGGIQLGTQILGSLPWGDWFGGDAAEESISMDGYVTAPEYLS